MPKTVMMTRLLLTALALASATPALARGGDQDAAYDAARAGNIRPLPDLLSRARSEMGGGTYLGSSFDMESRTYRFRYMQGRDVQWLDMDGRTGAVVGRSRR
jgi:hypothetical protein